MPAPPVTEGEIRPVILQLLARSKDGFMTTAALLTELEDIFKPDGADAEPAPGRAETRFSQKVQYVVSQHKSPTSLIATGLTAYHADKEGVEITDAGRAFVKANGL